MRLAAIWLVLFAAYAATLGIASAGGERFAGDEPHHLLLAESVVSDGDVDLADEYAAREYERFSERPVRPSGALVLGRLHEPQGLGTGLAIAPAYALGGPSAVQWFLAALTAFAFVLAAALARRLVPEPWASSGVGLVGLSPPVLAAATTVAPEPIAGALLAGAALCALRVRDRARLRFAYGGAAMLAALPWLDASLAVTGIPVGLCLVRWTSQERRRLVALLSGELMLGSLVVYARLNESLYGGPTPASARLGGFEADVPLGWLDRLPQIAGLWLDRDAGLLRWAPVLALAFSAGWLLWRSRRAHVATAIAERREAELAAELLLAVCAAHWLAAALAQPSLDGPFFAGEPYAAALPCCGALAGWGLRRARRAGAALGALTLAASAWLAIALWTGAESGWAEAAAGSPAPWGPLEAAFPAFEGDPVWPAAASALVLAALAALAWREWRERPGSGAVAALRE